MSCCPGCDLRRELARLQHSRLLVAGGYGIYQGLVARQWQAEMLEEALRGEGRADEVASGIDTEEVRGGSPARRMVCVEGGEILDELYAARALMDFVADEVGMAVRRCGMRASYTIYDGAASHLDVHRDVQGCDIALVTCLHDSNPSKGGGAIDLWLDDLATPLGEIRAHPDRGRSRLRLAAGDSLLIHGGLVPHRVPPCGGDRLRVVSLMCFEA